ncbi:MAG: UDP-N-acetylmuramoyl-tripeptide--D-alanyl-D-alanine ligase [Candidatus Scalindua rubra]|uniref:UDP-N-acetylmuramoyl-tripeptide--D-alanyl-D-alanine ligase n=1 Tax=Candidatus Scalindua brodae TaxID=237368 RepID=A0A0B0ENW7_9BACT|nr:MAG: UDP-N-acetylmuramoylalanyl-D-glutamyl-2, 6-diaminopimelate/D-alanyl-D-alanyl ligase [Candidatus Scalindua brodae]MBZ0109723.1 UDP-N-acetylmuramoyl-tripeptide--D-alanyl-D-alanine ligase [Candidatus Scalindua rubra]TWU32404.1 UDP-N-acetylmuramoyl-tripeptide--D-alanyl-D-alanine ligase [Candidatus Brocadiaceae bacterium S225]
MNNTEISDVLKAINGELLLGSPESRITGISTDSRSIKEGELFFALEGENYDGHKFVDQAVSKGVAGAVISSNKDIVYSLLYGLEKCILIEVVDTLKALGDLAKFYRKSLRTNFIAVTGSNGKTTTKDMIYHVLRNFNNVTRSRKSFNNFIGVPLTIFDTDSTQDFCVVEMGTNAPGEIRRLSEIIFSDFTVLTNISCTHLECLGSIEGVANEKAELIENMTEDGILITNADDDWCNRIANRFDGKVISFGFNKSADIRASNVKRNDTGFDFTINDSFTVKLSVLGKHNIYNAMAAIAICNAVGIGMENICDKFIDFRLPPMRMEKQVYGDIVVINDGYNSNPSSMSAALEEFSQLNTPGRKILVCGDMLEMGNYAESVHREIGAKVAKSGIDALWTVGSLSGFVAEEAIANGMPEERIRSCATSEEVSSFVVSQLKKDDTVLIKGSRGMKLENVVRQIESRFSRKNENNSVLLSLV